tara:strand:- start:196 stop:1425 length:1230 start_codon:yes stop_codon:yes gene_type:complete
MLISGNLFCGYYDYSPLNIENTYLLAHKVNQINRFPEIGEECEIVLYNLENEQIQIIDKTSAWNWQQGSRAQWLGPEFKDKIIYNKFINGKLCSIIKNITTKEENKINNPIFSVSKNGERAVSYDFSRLAQCRKSYSYAKFNEIPFEAGPGFGEGIVSIDLKTGEYRETLNIEKLLKIKPLPSMKTGFHWVDSPFLSPSGNTIFFLHRWTINAGFYSRVYSMDFNGENLELVLDSGTANHMTVINDEEIIFDGVHEKSLNRFKKYSLLTKVYQYLFPIYQKFVANREAFRQNLIKHYYYSISKKEKKTRKEVSSLISIGHPSICPTDNNIFLADTYETPSKEGIFYRHLYVCDRSKDSYCEIYKIFSSKKYNGTSFRADLHPKWNIQGDKIILDIIENDERKIVIKDFK